MNKKMTLMTGNQVYSHL